MQVGVRDTISLNKTETEAAQKLLQENPDLHDLVKEAHENISSGTHDDVDRQTADWFKQYTEGNSSADSFPHHVEVDGDYIVYKGERFHMTELQMYQRDVEHYVDEQFDTDVKYDDITPEKFPNLAFDQAGKPALYGDEKLAEQMNLPDTTKVVQDAQGNIRSVYRPESIPAR